MSETTLAILQWYGAGAGMLGALIVSLNLGPRKTGYGFIVFVTSSIALIAWGFMNDEGMAVGWQNVGLLAINLLGVYRYLIAGESDDDMDEEAEGA